MRKLTLVVALLLTSCSPAPMTATIPPQATPTASETPLPSPTPSPTPTVEPTPSPEDILHDTCYYGQEEIDSFQDIIVKQIEVNGENLEAMVGTDNEGNEQILAAKMTTYTGEKVWTRISITDLGGDNGQMVLWMNPDQDGSIQVNENTAKVFKDFFFRVVGDGGQGASITNMEDGKITLETPQAHYESGGSEVDWVENTLDLKNVEIRMFQSPDEWKEFVADYPEIAAKVYSSSFGRSGYGTYFASKEDGGTLMIVLGSLWESTFDSYWNGDEIISVSKELVKESQEKDVFYGNFWITTTVFAYRLEGKYAFGKAYASGQGMEDYPYSMVAGAFEMVPDGFIEIHSLVFP